MGVAVSETLELSVKPEIYLLQDLISELALGKIRVPKFQRPYVWRPEQMLNLLDSIERNYPIGSILVWDTSLPLQSLERVGDLAVPQAGRGAVSFLLDGHQRLSTLLGVLRRPMDARRGPEQKDWMWWVYRVLGEPRQTSSKFTHWRRAGDPPVNYLPLGAAMRTVDFLAFAREMQRRADEEGYSPSVVSEWIEEAEEFAQQFKSYRIAVVRLGGGDLSQAVSVFSRLNSEGQSMTPDQMVSALTYTEGQGESLGQRIDVIQEALASDGFGEVASASIFRTILACAGEEDVMDARWEALAGRVSGKLEEAVTRAEDALMSTVIFLREHLDVSLSRLVPYNLQIILLAKFFAHCPNPTSQQAALLRKWFWATSLSGHFAGANTTQVKDALAEMQRFAEGGDAPVSIDGVARPFPDRFDLRGARVRTFVIWDLCTFTRRLDASARPIDARELLAEADTRAYRHIVTAGIGELMSSPANRMVFPTPRGTSVRRALMELDTRGASLVEESHGIPPGGIGLLRSGEVERFVVERSQFLANEERRFIESQGVRSSDTLVGETDIDTGSV